MKEKTVSVTILTLLLISVLASAVNIQPVKASGTIYIRADGSIDPSTAPIQRNRDLYTLTDNIVSDADGIVIERNNMTLDGAGYTVQGLGNAIGLFLSGRSNVTVKNAEIRAFYYGIQFSSSNSSQIESTTVSNNTIGIALYHSPNNTIRNDKALNNFGIGILLSFCNCTMLAGNEVLKTSGWPGMNGIGIELVFDYNNTFLENVVSDNHYRGFYLQDPSSYNVFRGNNVSKNPVGIYIESVRGYGCSYNEFFENNVSYNEEGIFLTGNPGEVNSNNIISENNITTNNHNGILLYSSNTTHIFRNNITANKEAGIRTESQYDEFSQNNVRNSKYGIYLYGSGFNSVSENNITNNRYGVYCHKSLPFPDEFYHNNFIENTNQVYLDLPSDNVWDDGYPPGGNYWSDYTGIDVKSGSNQDVLGSDSIGDTPYIIDGNNRDHYPLINPYGSFSPYTLTITTTAGGATNPIPGVHAFSNGQNVCIHALSNTGYLFDHWELDSINVGSINPIIITMDTSHTLHATFIENHNIAITNVSTLGKTIVGQNFSISINVTVENRGDYAETFTITIYANTAPIALQPVTLSDGGSATISFSWKTEGVVKANHIISAYAGPVPGDIDPSDNTYIDGTVLVTIQGDVTGDRKVDGKDVALVAEYLGKHLGQPDYAPNADVNNDGKIDGKDIAIVAKNYGKTDP
jgi:parallel beta-helix repeat protein